MSSAQRFATNRHPVFILGILQRSGTNYLNNLLLLHPHVQPPGIVWEDFHLAHADMLKGYTEVTARHWPKKWSESLQTRLGEDALLRAIGQGIINFIEQQNAVWIDQNPEWHDAPSPITLVSATPSVVNLHLFFDLFPNAAPIIVVRDGPTLVESGVRSFAWDYEEAIRMWRRGAERILEFASNPHNSGRFVLVRYEDLFTRNTEVMIEILDFLGLDKERYDFEAAKNLAVMGSSEVAKSNGHMHWKAIEKRADFNPLKRASGWSPELRSRFAWLAASDMHAMGYSIDSAPEKPVWNAMIDHLYGLELKLKPAFPALGGRLKAFRTRLLNVDTRD